MKVLKIGRAKQYAVLVVFATLIFSMATQIVSAFYTLGVSWSGSVNPLYYYDNDGYTETTSAASSWAVTGVFSYSSGTSASPIHVHSARVTGVAWDGQSDISGFGTTITDVQTIINTYYCDSYSSAARKSVICHELGHALGLNENPDIEVVRSVMNPYTFGDYSRYGYWAISSPTTDDFNGVNYIY